jgi:predicted dehydrogenase
MARIVKKTPMKKIQFVIITVALMSCQSNNKETTAEAKTKPVQLITLDPGHFHAALIQKTMYDDVDPVVYVYAPAGNDLELHLNRINGYNSRTETPTQWKEEAYTGPDFFEKMIADKKGNVVVLAGNNEKKTEYILKALEAGLNVLADKPMAITPADFELLKKAFEVARKKGLLLYDIMTERFEINTILQKEISMIPEIFGELKKGTPANPAVEMISDHCFYKYISGNVLTRPAWFFDASQQGEGIVDVTTHLIDLVQWGCFPRQTLDYSKDIAIVNAERWPTQMTASKFKLITKLDSIPAFLKKNLVNDSTLAIYSNGEIDYTIRGVHAKVVVQWNYTNEAGGDTHYSTMRGTKADLVIRQGKEQNFKPVLYIEPVNIDTTVRSVVEKSFKTISANFPGIELIPTAKGWSIQLPQSLAEGHEAHFARVTGNFLGYLKNKNMPSWEVPNMLAKYYTTTKALEVSLKK